MLRIKAPATSANLGSGFDCFGIAFDLYNTFTVETGSEDAIINDDPRFNTPDNLFLQGYRKGCAAAGIEDHVHVRVDADIPVSRGLGSSAAMITGGLTAASVLHDDALNEDQIFELAAEMEGHPDNAAPCVYGGLTASGIYNQHFITHSLSLHPDWHFTVFIPDFEVSTAHARAILPDAYSRCVTASCAANAVFEAEALRTGSLALLQAGSHDQIHEPYRRKLIRTYDQLKEAAEENHNGVLFISGSGSTCLLIAKNELTSQQKRKIQNIQDAEWEIRDVHPCQGTEIWGDQP